MACGVCGQNGERHLGKIGLWQMGGEKWGEDVSTLGRRTQRPPSSISAIGRKPEKQSSAMSGGEKWDDQKNSPGILTSGVLGVESGERWGGERWGGERWGGERWGVEETRCFEAALAAKRGSQMGGPKEEAEPDDAAKGVRGWRGWWERLPIQAIPPPPASLTERLSHSGHQIHSEDKKRNVHSESSGWSSETEPMKGSLRIQGLSRRIWRHSSSSIAQPPRSRQLPIARGVKAAGHYVGNKQITSFPSIHNVCKNRQKK